MEAILACHVALSTRCDLAGWQFYVNNDMCTYAPLEEIVEFGDHPAPFNHNVLSVLNLLHELCQLLPASLNEVFFFLLCARWSR